MKGLITVGSTTSELVWRHGSRCSTGDCVEAADVDGAVVYVRDSKDRSGPVLMFTADQWREFIAWVKE